MSKIAVKAAGRAPAAAKRSRSKKPAPARVIIGLGSCGIAAGAREVEEAFRRQLASTNGRVELGQTGCMGMCYSEVMVEITGDGRRSMVYGNVTPAMVPRIVQEHIVEDRPISEWLVLRHGGRTRESDFLAKQTRIVLRNCGQIDPENIDDYIARDGYRALQKALTKVKPAKVIETIKASGLRGRGGAGFSTGQKWEFARNAPGDKKYIICNADEGDPGAFMDRSVLESDPHSVLEGMAIGAYAIGCDEGYIYVRAEYPLAIKRLRIAIKQAEERGFLGKNILGTDFSFDLHIKEGAGAFVCGEETALMASVEGKRGMPRMRPPFPAVSGLWGKPTNINNVETFANVSWIMLHGAGRYARIGSGASKGTKVFALTGKVKRSGLVEVPMGMTLREIIFDIGGGIKGDARIRAVQIGGPSGGCLPEKLLDTRVEYEALAAVGAIVGSGGMVVTDERTCMVNLAKYFLAFTQNESCGKCVPCRLGTKRMLEIVTRITEGQSEQEDEALLERLARDVKASSLCGLGQTAPNPVLTTLRYFKDEYDEHIRERRCHAGVCDDLAVYLIKESLCKGCLVCKKHCPVGAISGKSKEIHVIDEARCIKCGVCVEHCPFDAIYRA